MVELARLGVPPACVKLVFNMVDSGLEVEPSFFFVVSFLAEQPVATANPACRLGMNEIYARVRASGADLASLAGDDTDYKSLIAQTTDTAQKLAWAQKLATRRAIYPTLPPELAAELPVSPLSIAERALGLVFALNPRVIPLVQLNLSNTHPYLVAIP